MKPSNAQKLTFSLGILGIGLGLIVSPSAYVQQKPEVFAQNTNTAVDTTTVDPQNRNQSCSYLPSGELLIKTELFFGFAKPDGSEVSEKEFQDFVNTQITPRFPNGLTLLSGAGQFRNSNGTIIREKSQLLIVLYPFNSDSNKKIEEIRQRYRSQFQQESVLRVDEALCVSL